MSRIKRLSVPIKQPTQLLPMDLVFSVTQTQDNFVTQIRNWWEFRQLKKRLPDVEESCLLFNNVRVYWGTSFSTNLPTFVEWTKVGKKYIPRIVFIEGMWVLNINNAWVFRHESVIQRGLENREGFELTIGKMYQEGPYSGNMLRDVHALMLKANLLLGKSVPNSVPELMQCPKLVLVNSGNDIEKGRVI